MTVEEIARYTGLPISRQKNALHELVTRVRFLTIDTAGTYVVEKFDEKCGAESQAVSNAERQRNYRERNRNARNGSDVTRYVTRNEGSNVTTVTDKEEEEDKDILPAHFVRRYASNVKVVEPDEVASEPWLQELGDRLFDFSKATLGDLSLDQRKILGRVHAAIFAGYRRDERKNANKGAALVASLARMANSRFRDLTCREYLLYGLKVLELRNGKPFHSPFDIEAVVEYEA